jgi:Nif-specific regulatory protein
MIPGYRTIGEIYRGRKRIVYRGIRQRDRLPVIIKTLISDSPSERDLAGLRREYQILQNLQVEGVVKAYGLEKYHNRLALILEDIGGEPVRSLIDAHRVDFGTFLKIASLLSQTVGDLHRHQIVHRDITPKNIIVNASEGKVRLIDFSISSRIGPENQQLGHSSVLQGTPAYMAPEQTGRMNRAVDYRADLYSLGVTFYELLTGRLPFQSSDPLELVHFHIAKAPTPPHLLDPNLPRPISEIVMRLLAKNAEDRYKSAYGLKSDLDACAAQWHTTGAIRAFALAENDFSEHFQVSQKLYGREHEIATLIEAFERVSRGTSEMMLVAGYSGIGKSALVNEVHKPIVRERGHFIFGKFDQFKRNIPYSALIQAFQELVRQILTESDDRIRAWRDKLTEALGPNGQVIVEVIPEVELVIGPQPAVPVLGAAENQNRFNRVFQQFSRVFAQQEHPLVIFLDDLQWADIPTLNLIKVMVTDPDTHYLFMVGAYRDNEVDESHPLLGILGEIQKQKHVESISLKALAFEHVNELMADTLGCPQDRSMPLAELVYQKTEGNPFFINMFLKSLYQERLISFDGTSKAWTFDLEKIRALDITDNVVDLMVRRIRKLPATTQSALSLAASIGNHFDVKTLAVIGELTLPETSDALRILMDHGLVLTAGEGEEIEGRKARFRFLHDRVQQAAYSLISEAERPALHLKIGRLLLSTMTADEIEENRFEIVDHLNSGASLVTDPAERLRLAELNLEAARKAKRSSAYEPALKYVTAGMAYLPENAWKEKYDLIFSYYLEKGELEYLVAKWDQAIASFDDALGHAVGVLDRSKVSLYKVILYRVKNELRISLNIALGALEELGVKLVEPDEAQLKEEINQFYRLIDQDTDALFNLPELQDPAKLMALVLMREAMNGAFFVGSRLLFTISMKMVEITIREGNSPHAAVAYMYQAAFTLAGLVCDFENAHRLGKLALRLNEERYHFKPYEAIILNNWGGFISHHTEDVDTARSYLEKGYYIALENGMYTWTGYCVINRLYISFWGSDTLGEVLEKIDGVLPWLKRFDQNMAQYFSAIKATLLNLREPAEDWRVLSESVWPNGNEVVRIFRERDDLIGLLVNATCRLSLANWYSDYRTAVHYADLGSEYVVAGLGMYLIPAFHFHKCLAYAAAHDHVDAATQSEYKGRIKSTLPKFEQWARHSPPTYLHRLQLIKAELARVEGDPLEAMDLYNQAIRNANRSGFIQDEALASERCARFWLSRGDNKIATLYLAEAYYAYERWGARAKARDLEANYPQISFRAGAQSFPGLDTQITLSTIVRGSDSLDLTTVMKASQVISSEIVLDRLLAKTMKIALESAGAQKGVLVLEKEGGRSIEAEASIDREELDVRYFDFPKPNDYLALPESVGNYVRRTGESLVLAEAEQERRFSSDPYILRRKPKSILCIPILNQAKRMGILYLENNLTANAFKPDRIQVMQMLLSQAAISLENARLYDEMKQEVARRRQAEERERALLAVNNAIISNLTQENLLHAIFNALRQVVPFDWSAIFLHNAEKNVLRMIALERSRPSTHFEVGYEISMEEGNAGWAFRNQKFSLRRDLEKERNYATEELLFSEGVRSLCAAPLIVRRQSIGTLSVVSETPNQYSEADGEFLQEVANQVALAIENMRSYEEIASLKARFEAENVYLQEEIRTEHNFAEIVGNSPALLTVLRKVEQIAATDSTVLILGETGTGKELIARAIHDRSARKARPLVKVNCSAISAGLVESELFGHMRGAFTGAIDRRVGRFELADGGTIFLDEIGELPLETQVKLLRVLQEQEFEPVGSSRTLRVNVRIIAATNRDLEEAVHSGRFRSDLFYRLNVFPIWMPSLRERRSDIPSLVTFFLERFSKRFGKAVDGVTQATMRRLVEYSWPGNVRELQNIVERGMVLSQGPVLTLDPALLPIESSGIRLTPSVVASDTTLPNRSFVESRPWSSSNAASLEHVEREHVLSVLKQTGGVIEGAKGAARILNLHPNTLRSRMKKLGIEAKRLRHEMS